MNGKPFKVTVHLVLPDGHVLKDVYQVYTRPTWDGSVLKLGATGLGWVEIPRRHVLRVTTEVDL